MAVHSSVPQSKPPDCIHASLAAAGLLEAFRCYRKRFYVAPTEPNVVVFARIASLRHGTIPEPAGPRQCRQHRQRLRRPVVEHPVGDRNLVLIAKSMNNRCDTAQVPVIIADRSVNDHCFAVSRPPMPLLDQHRIAEMVAFVSPRDHFGNVSSSHPPPRCGRFAVRPPARRQDSSWQLLASSRTTIRVLRVE